jgi:hypothetical protein
VPAFLKALNDRSLPVPWDVNRPSPSTLIGVTALAQSGLSDRGRNHGGGGGLT